MRAIIGVDPHKATHTAVVVNDREDELGRKKVRACRTQVTQLLCWAEPFPQRTWAIEGADRLGCLLAQQLVAASETVVDVPATMAARTRVLATGRSNKNDPNDALSVAITALRYDGLRRVSPVGHADDLRLLAKRNTDLGRQRSRQVVRLHALLTELTPGGIAKEINASDVDGFLAAVCPAGPTEQVRVDLALELLDDTRTNATTPTRRRPRETRPRMHRNCLLTQRGFVLGRSGDMETGEPLGSPLPGPGRSWRFSGSVAWMLAWSSPGVTQVQVRRPVGHVLRHLIRSTDS